MNNKIKYSLAISLLVILTAIFFGPAITGRSFFITGDIDGCDIVDYNYPVRDFLGASLRKLSPAVWNPYIFCGFPSHAESQGGYFYPINILLFSALPSPLAFNFSIILSFLLAGVFFWIYARTIGIKITGSTAGAVIYMFSGFFMAHLKHLNMINVVTWIPLLFYSIEMLLRKKQIKYIMLTGIIIGFQLLAGHLQLTYYSVITAFIYAACRFLSLNRYKKNKMELLKKMLFPIILVIIIAAGLAAVQLLPSTEFKPLSTRSGALDYEQTAKSLSYKPGDLLTLILPAYFGDPAKANYRRADAIFWENCAFVGILPAILSIIGIVFMFRRNAYVRFYSFLMLFSFMFILQNTFPLQKLLWYCLPGINLFRFHSRYLIIAIFSLALLAGSGLDYIMEQYGKTIAQKIMKYASGVLIILIIAYQLLSFGRGHNAMIDSKTWFDCPETVKFLKGDKSLYRTFTLFWNFRTLSSYRVVWALAGGWKGDLSPFVRNRNLLMTNSNMIYGISSAGGYSSIFLKRFYELQNTLAGTIGFNEQTWAARIPDNFLKILGLLNVKYILSVWDLRNNLMGIYKSVFLMDRMPDIKVFSNPYYLPRVLLVPHAQVLKEKNEILGTLFSSSFNPQETVILEEEPELYGSPSAEGSTAEINKYSDREVCITVNMTNTAFLLLTDTNYPGWKVSVDGKKKNILQADYLFRAVAVEKGRHIVRFVYGPVSFYFGFIISLLTIIALGVVFLKKRNSTL